MKEKTEVSFEILFLKEYDTRLTVVYNLIIQASHYEVLFILKGSERMFVNDFKKRVLTNYFVTSGVYVGLFVGGNEVSTSDYERKQITFNTPREIGNTVIIDNDDAVEFDYAESDWGVITHVGIFDSLTGGNLLDYAELDNEADITADTQFWIDEGGYRIEWGD